MNVRNITLKYKNTIWLLFGKTLATSLLPNQKLSLYLIIGIMKLSVHSCSILQTLFQRQRQNAVC